MELNIDYPICPVPRWGYGKSPHSQLYTIINENRLIYKEILLSFLKYKRFFLKIQKNDTGKEYTEPHWNNNFYQV